MADTKVLEFHFPEFLKSNILYEFVLIFMLSLLKGPFVMVEDFIRLTLESQLPDPPASGMCKVANGK